MLKHSWVCKKHAPAAAFATNVSARQPRLERNARAGVPIKKAPSPNDDASAINSRPLRSNTVLAGTE